MLPDIVKKQLRDLGIPHLSTKKGRPPGRKYDRFYLAYVEGVQRIVEEDGIYQKRSQAKAKRGENWHQEFRNLLERDGWPLADIYWLTTSKSPRSFAIHKAAGYFNVSYDAAARACRRAKAAKK
jgi:hypothetical protein